MASDDVTLEAQARLRAASAEWAEAVLEQRRLIGEGVLRGERWQQSRARLARAEFALLRLVAPERADGLKRSGQ